MHKHDFSIKELLEFGWSKTKTNYWFILQVMIIAGLAYGASRFLGPVSVLVGFAVGICITTVALMLVHGHTPALTDLFAKYKGYTTYLNYAIVSVINGILVVGGFFLFIIPGIFFLVKLQFAKTLVVDKDMPALDALKKSWEMTNGNFWPLLGYILVIALINFIGAIPLGLGLLVTVPVSILASLKLYNKFLGQ